MHSAMRSRLEPFKKFVRVLRSHLDGILAWTKQRISNTSPHGRQGTSAAGEISIIILMRNFPMTIHLDGRRTSEELT